MMRPELCEENRQVCVCDGQNLKSLQQIDGFNPFAADGKFGQYKMMQKLYKKMSAQQELYNEYQ